MAIDLREYERLRKNAEEMQRLADQKAGALEQIKTTLLKDYNCKSFKDAEAFYNKLVTQEKELSAMYDKMVAKLKKDYPALFEEKD